MEVRRKSLSPGPTLVLGLWAVLNCQGCRSLLPEFPDKSTTEMIPEREELLLGENSYRRILNSAPPTANTEAQAMVERVGRRLADVSARPGLPWEFHVLANPARHLFCLPGGKVVVYEGLLSLCQNEADLAVVMSHEMGHVLAHHGSERMNDEVDGRSRGLLGRSHRDPSPHQEALFQTVYGLSNNRMMTPYNPRHEAEADSIGLSLMAQAGYDPREAPRVWTRLSRQPGSHTPEFLLTHPSNPERETSINRMVASANAFYQHAPDKVGMGDPIPQSPVKQTWAAEMAQNQRPLSPSTMASRSSVVDNSVPSPRTQPVRVATMSAKPATVTPSQEVAKRSRKKAEKVDPMADPFDSTSTPSVAATAPRRFNSGIEQVGYEETVVDKPAAGNRRTTQPPATHAEPSPSDASLYERTVAQARAAEAANLARAPRDATKSKNSTAAASPQKQMANLPAWVSPPPGKTQKPSKSRPIGPPEQTASVPQSLRPVEKSPPVRSPEAVEQTLPPVNPGHSSLPDADDPSWEVPHPVTAEELAQAPIPSAQTTAETPLSVAPVLPPTAWHPTRRDATVR